MDALGFRTEILQGIDLRTTTTHQPSFHEFIGTIGDGQLAAALQERDEKIGDDRTKQE